LHAQKEYLENSPVYFEHSHRHHSFEEGYQNWLKNYDMEEKTDKSV
jgi:hypothetical protein